MNSPSKHIERSLKITDLISVAYSKQEEIKGSPYYETFGKMGERQNDLIKNQLTILRLQTWFYQAIEKARECKI